MPGKGAAMRKSPDYAQDVARMNLLRDSLLRQIGKGRKISAALERGLSSGKNAWHEGSDETAIGFEASWAGVFPSQE